MQDGSANGTASRGAQANPSEAPLNAFEPFKHSNTAGVRILPLLVILAFAASNMREVGTVSHE